MSRTRGLIVALSLLLVAAIATGAWLATREMAELRRVRAERDELRSKNEQLTAAVRELEGRIQEREAQAARTVTLYFVVSRPTDFVLVPEDRTIVGAGDPKEIALRELIAGPRTTADAQAVIPRDTRVLDLRVEGTTAIVDFSQDITRMNVGSSVEALAVASIVNTLTEFPGVDRVQILVGGQKLESLAGHVDISEPLARNEDVIEKRS